MRNGDKDSLTRMGLGKFACDLRGLERKEGRRFLDQKSYPEAEWRSSMRPIGEVSGHDRPPKPEGLKRIVMPEGQLPRMRHEKR